MILSTMQDRPLTISALFQHGRKIHSESEVVTFLGENRQSGENRLLGEEYRRCSFGQLARRAAQLASALRRLGIKPGDRVGTFCWNTQEHLEAYLAVPSMGAVLHTLNIRLFADQLAYIINHAEDRIIIVEDSLVPALSAVVSRLERVEQFIVIGDGDASVLGKVLRYETLLALEEPEYDWPAIDERSAAAMCYTSGTTGDPKGVVYSHRSTYLHSLAACSADVFGLSQSDRVLLIVPLFHANAWGMPYASWLTGADLIMPGRFLQAAPLCRLIEAERPTFSGAVPTIWNDILHYTETNRADLSSLRLVTSGGSAVPRSLIERFKQRLGVQIMQAWGMTETSPLGAISRPPKGCRAEEELDWRAKSGRVTAGVELRLMDGDRELPWDAKSIGEIEVRGPWITASYYREDSTEKFHDGWLRTGDVGTVDAKGFIQITDRAKDVIKSGGEWISSVELETRIMSHPDVMEAAVIGVPDERWDERPLACVVLKSGAATSVEDLRAHLASQVAKWWIPERWAILSEIPKTSVGKFDKKVLRAQLAEGMLIS
jgi:fatty-acyl-CoA synthase